MTRPGQLPDSLPESLVEFDRATDGGGEPPPSAALLPSGLRDVLPPEAETEARAIETMMGIFAAHGYDRVKPPLLEFEDSLFGGSGAAVAGQAFRLMDPDTHRMMGLRPDMTPQVARIAATRLRRAPRPLRLAYAGPCVLLHGATLDPERQVSQAGIELIGIDDPRADAEIVAVAAEALDALNVPRVSFDLTLPRLAAVMIEQAELGLDQRRRLLHALDRKDAAIVAREGGPLAGVLGDLLLSAGPVPRALAMLMAAPLAGEARRLAERLEASVQAIRARLPLATLTLDPVDFRGWQYHTGVSVTVYAGREQVGRGGQYVGGADEPACGLTLRPEALLRAAPARPARPRVWVPASAIGQAEALRAQGFVTIAGFDSGAACSDAPGDDIAEAARLGCTHILRDGQAWPM
ncbi:ATP phosphoribosyltransferase regulatory subunit [Endobacter medicaginis]|uniref:ATP phosphoribosyltransferase regulatory subunit n=3 Tax=Endobacter medicaginis TaxID=1181271 RepID=A0A839V0V5_9PROT|nr:ATP phosphoribosyltransferase regulatory subunit [Endobacter medicaginis]MBB3174303.1 ATP phosphoribosyltransferase regulatory subunit [Endobacter medicaginis]MCX5476185.1 ATP phosphoribosyltransferase regulatory subunit [Endobacter medicaginis]